MKLAIVDLDGVVANADMRFAKAEEAKQAREKEIEFTGMTEAQIQRECSGTFWQTVFTPELVALDTLIDGVVEAISFLERYPTDDSGYRVIFLTSRPESMRKATDNWLFEHELQGPRLLMKAPAFQFTKTLTWKVGMVQTLCQFYDADELLFIDDEKKHREATMDAFLGSDIDVIVASSLADAFEKLKEDE